MVDNKENKEKSTSLQADGNIKPPSWTKSVWPSAVTSSKYAKRIVMVMRSEERVDRVFGENWGKTEFPSGKVHATDLNIPASKLKKLRSLNDLQNNAPVTVLGKYKAIIAARAILNRHLCPSMIICSPALRCIETAAAVAGYLKIPIAIEPGLCENSASKFYINYRAHTNGIKVNEEYVPVVDFKDIGEETELETSQRLRRVLRTLIELPRERPLFLVAHANAHFTLANLANSVPFQEQTVIDQVLDPIELGLRYPPGCILSAARCTEEDDAPPAYALVPNMIPALTLGSDVCNAPIIQ